MKYDKYDLSLTVTDLVGGTPKNPELIRAWHAARWPAGTGRLGLGDPATPEEATERTIQALGAGVDDDPAAAMWSGFVEVDGTPALESRQVKAALKEAANILRDQEEFYVRGKPIFLRSKLAEQVFVLPKVLPLTGKVETREHPVHAMTRQGPRTSLKRVDYIRTAGLAATLAVAGLGTFTEDRLRSLLDYAAINGLGAERSQGHGQFTWELDHAGTFGSVVDLRQSVTAR
ncbi:MAG: hypothetical protein ACRD0D_01500 [Acidimicrobiales bacterium]